MPLDLPGPIAEYFAAEQARDALALARCFVDDGVVHDEGGTFRGPTAIRDWNAAAREKYHHTVITAKKNQTAVCRSLICASVVINACCT